MFPKFSIFQLEIVPGSSLYPLYRLPGALPHVEQAVEVPLVAVHRGEPHPANSKMVSDKS